MTHERHDAATSNVLAWSGQSANMPMADEEASAEADEPPDLCLPVSGLDNSFQRTAVRRANGTHASLLTKALQSHEEDSAEARPDLAERGRRRSMTSNVSFASTAELTCDTGLTSPSRTNSPSPRLPDIEPLRLNLSDLEKKQSPEGLVIEQHVRGEATPKTEQPPKEEAPKKRCISFACAAKPIVETTAPPVPVTSIAPSAPPPEAPKRPCIKFACPAPRRPAQNTLPSAQPQIPVSSPELLVPRPQEANRSSSAIRKSPSPARSHSSRPSTPRRVSTTPVSIRPKKYYTANPNDVPNCARFHEFTSGEPREEDWIRQTVFTPGKITINDTLTKENAIRKLGTEVEEEAEQEERDEKETLDADEDPDNVDEEENGEDGEEVPDDGGSGYGSDDDGSDGYHTDEETGFAASDDENDDDDGLHLWTPGRPRLSGGTPVVRRPSFGDESDDSIGKSSVRAVRGKTQHIKIRPGTPELPDSTDFVCGTLDEDRPMEDAYISCIAARRRENLHLIPQDIDPSFPASDPENEEEEDRYNPVHHDSDEEVWLHGEMEDLHHEQDRRSRKKKGDHQSPKRYHSPPPKRLHSPPPKARGRSPKRLFDGHSPRRMRSPPLQALKSPPASPHNGTHAMAFKDLGCRPGMTQTKSLPRPPAMFPQMKHGRKTLPKNTDMHIRGAIDIVKGLQQKRQRRKEKFYQNYCNRARKGQIPERPKHRPGQGAERMRELGLLMAGKIDHGNYVLSV